MDGFTNGFRLQHFGKVTHTQPPNDFSINKNFSVAQQKISDEVLAGRLVGPFLSPPFKVFHVSPLKLREKSTPGKFRLIHNLSWPYDDTSINAAIPQSSKTVNYAGINQAIRIIMNHPKGALTAKSDIKDAFKIIPIHHSDHHKLGLKLGEFYYYDTTLSLGAGSSCNIFEEFSTALDAIFKFDSHPDASTHYLDDFFFVAVGRPCLLSRQTLFDLICDDINVPQALDKKTHPSHRTEYLGILLDSLNWIAELPLDKLRSYTQEVLHALRRKKLTQTELQSLVGKLSFAASVVPARPFLRRLIDKIHSVSRPYHFVKITSEMRQDLRTWLEFLHNYNGVTYFRHLQVLPQHHLFMSADACALGYGACFMDHWVQDVFPTHWIQLFRDREIGITLLELYPIYVLISMFGPVVRNQAVLFRSDNEGVVQIINKQSSPNPYIMKIVRPLVLSLIHSNISLRSEHIPGVNNQLCDLISRFQVTEDLLRSHSMRLNPTPIPRHLQAQNFLLK